MKTSNKKPPHCIRINPKNGARKLYATASEAARDLKLDPVVVANACAKRLGMRRYGGYEWDYTDAYKKSMRKSGFAGKRHTMQTRQQMSRAKDAKKKPVKALRKDGSVYGTYESVAAAARALHTHHGSVRAVLAGIHKTHRGLVWKPV